ncbi:multidrug efflux system membrane fusion protein [Phenylobacterium haematophilum]|uniref:Multidrug efflux system membrane fusion protein n=1 Tax=Phenylobacterium haematophilum TaxID=98513 RepID=A0A839ZV32_9CAUL|nr:efflux RND transporter periplasmic adaptor subunit [Phenylobacterium haematophilum]MBB3889639.1 multidrug efflux system membrane fusion protein [Phenylobacterium haematophilum]
MRIKSQYLFVIAVVVVLVLAFTVGTVANRAGKSGKAEAKTADALPTVQAIMTPEATHEYVVAIRGRTEAARSVVVRSETAGVVAATPAIEGSFVRKGTVLCRLNVDARQATLDQARANLRSRQLQQKASADLAARGYRSQTQVLQDQANLDAAAATVRQAELGVEQMSIRAPFDGVFDKRDAEVGAYLSPGQPCGTMIELNPLLIVGDLPETEASKVKVGSTANAQLTSGETLAGKVRYAAREADAQTRTYRIEITTANPQMTRSGLSAAVRINAGSGPAHLVPLSSLVLDAAGRQGVRYVLADDKVAFAPIKVLEETPQGIWVTGLRGPARVITVGQSYVAEGQKVRVAAAR